MKSIIRLAIALSRSGNLGFVVVVLAAYFSVLATAGYGRPSLTGLTACAWAVAALLFMVTGTYGFAKCRRKGSLAVALLYFAAQFLLAISIIYIYPGGAIFLILLPLAAQAVVLLPPLWTAIACAISYIIIAAPMMLRGGFLATIVVSSIYMTALVFVVAFTQIAVKERKARAEVERLAAQLAEANTKLREYAVQAEELATTKERNRLAREIHDSLGHYLTVINVQIGAARAVLAADPARASDAMGKAQSLTQEGLAEVRRSVSALHTSPVNSRPLAEAVALLVDECSASGVEARLTIKGEPRPSAPQAELTLYRAVQEGLTNVRRHSRATRAEVTLDYTRGSKVWLTIEDDGIGMSASEGGFGLLGVRERAEMSGGSARVRTSDGGGFTLEVELPG